MRLWWWFVAAILALVVAKTGYSAYCNKHPDVCPQEEPIDYEKDGLPEVGHET